MLTIILIKQMDCAFLLTKTSLCLHLSRNIYKEIEEDLGIKNGTNGDLSDWAKQGVLLINSSLTVEQGIPGSHLNFGWEEFTDHIIKSFSKKRDIVFYVVGKFAANKKKFINQERNFVLEASHPSPLSCYKGFFGCKHFSKCNSFLKKFWKKRDKLENYIDSIFKKLIFLRFSSKKSFSISSLSFKVTKPSFFSSKTTCPIFLPSSIKIKSSSFRRFPSSTLNFARLNFNFFLCNASSQ